MRPLRTDERARGPGIAIFFLALIGGAPVLWIVQRAGDPVLNKAANATSSQAANDATNWFDLLITYLPAVFLLIGMFGLIVYAVYLRGIGQ